MAMISKVVIHKLAIQCAIQYTIQRAIRRNLASSIRIKVVDYKEKLNTTLFPTAIPDQMLALEGPPPPLRRSDELSAAMSAGIVADRVITRLRQRLIAIGSVVEWFYGVEACHDIGLRGWTPTQASALLTLARHVEKQLLLGLDGYELLLDLDPPDLIALAWGVREDVEMLHEATDEITREVCVQHVHEWEATGAAVIELHASV